MKAKQVIRGRLRWLAPDEGGLQHPVASDRWVRPAWIEPGDIERVASLVITGISPNQPISEDVHAYWLMWERIPDREWAVSPGAILAITEGTRAVAFLTVERVETQG